MRSRNTISIFHRYKSTISEFIQMVYVISETILVYSPFFLGKRIFVHLVYMKHQTFHFIIYNIRNVGMFKMKEEIIIFEFKLLNFFFYRINYIFISERSLLSKFS